MLREKNSEELKISASFMIFDELIQDEKADPEACYLYFHPPTFEIDQKLFLMGGILSMVAFVSNFSNGNIVEVAKCGNTKIAVTRIGNFFMVRKLTSFSTPLSTPLSIPLSTPLSTPLSIPLSTSLSTSLSQSNLSLFFYHFS